MGVGHTGFDIILNSNLTIQEAAVRRDFTMNTLCIDSNNDPKCLEKQP